MSSPIQKTRIFTSTIFIYGCEKKLKTPAFIGKRVNYQEMLVVVFRGKRDANCNSKKVISILSDNNRRLNR